MNKLLNVSLKRYLIYAGVVLIGCIPVYYLAISVLWHFELKEHHIILTPQAGREDTLLILGAVTLLTTLFFIFLLGGVIILNRNISRRLWQPFYKSLDYIRTFNLDQDQQVDFAQTNITEFAELNKRLEKLLSANIAAYRHQKEFADNASHELQTPLAIIQSKLEVLMQTQPLSGQQFNYIEDALTALSRLSRINKSLLLLTKIENRRYIDKEDLNITELLKQIVESFADFLNENGLGVSLFVEENIYLKSNKALVEILLQNLLSNAIRYTPEHGYISINLSSTQLDINNTGLEPLDQNQLFKRFVTSSGTGLGLSIAHQICKQYNWRLDYQFSSGMHGFSILF